MRIIHTADWHLGKCFHDLDRYDEHQGFLDWLISIIKQEKVDLLLVAGDVFDVSCPPTKSTEQYYNFFAKLFEDTACGHAVVVGGNHDSALHLNAPREILKCMKLHVVGGATDLIENEIIEIKNHNGEVEAVVCGVPFLRDKDIHYNKANLSQAEREKHVIDSIGEHYATLASIVEKRYTSKQVPIIATGHLFAQGCKNSELAEEDIESEKSIYVGNLGKVPAQTFPEIFDYVALGHLHSCQIVGKKEHIRYSGSPIPLSFSERADKKGVILLDFEGKTLKNIEKLLVPTHLYRRLIRIEGCLDEITSQIMGLEDETIIWAEVCVKLEKNDPHIRQKINDLNAQKENLKILRFATETKETTKDWTKSYQNQSLREMSLMEVFERCCEAKNYNPEEIGELKSLLSGILSQEND